MITVQDEVIYLSPWQELNDRRHREIEREAELYYNAHGFDNLATTYDLPPPPAAPAGDPAVSEIWIGTEEGML